MKISLILVGFAALTLSCSAEHSSPPAPDNTSAALKLKVDEDLQNQSLHVLQSNCAFCHGDSSTGKVNHITDVDHLISSGLIVVGEPAKGRLMGSISDGSMPLRSKLDEADRQVLKDWISSMQWIRE